MINALLVKLVSIAPPIPFNDATVNQRSAYFYGSIVTILVVTFIIEINVFTTIRAKLADAKRNRGSESLKNELDYADYLNWANQQGELPYFNKRVINKATKND